MEGIDPTRSFRENLAFFRAHYDGDDTEQVTLTIPSVIMAQCEIVVAWFAQHAQHEGFDPPTKEELMAQAIVSYMDGVVDELRSDE